MVDFGQLVDQKVNSWSTSTVRGFPCKDLCRWTWILVKHRWTKNEDLDWIISWPRPPKLKKWCKHELMDQWLAIHTTCIKDKTLQKLRWCGWDGQDDGHEPSPNGLGFYSNQDASVNYLLVWTFKQLKLGFLKTYPSIKSLGWRMMLLNQVSTYESPTKV